MSMIRDAIKRGISRRTFLKGAGSLAAAPLFTSLGGTLLTGCSSISGAAAEPDKFNTKLVILGSAGGVSYFPPSDRASASSALVVNGAIYLVDLGQGATNRLNQAFNTDSLVNPDGTYKDNPSSTFLSKVKALFFTHIHPDHIADYANLLLIGAGTGLNKANPLKVIGPCNRGCNDNNYSAFDVSRIIYTDSADPALITSTPGTVQMTNLIWQACGQAINDMMLDMAYPDYRFLVEVTEIGTSLPSPASPTCPATIPFLIYPEDENGVSVWATYVDHHQVYPAFAFRFNTPDGSVVFSGDTGWDTRGDKALPPDQGNLQVLAQGADILVHEVIDAKWVDAKFGKDPKEKGVIALKNHMLNSHTPVDKVGTVATNCNVKTLVLNHIVPGMAPLANLRQARQNFPGNLIISEDLMQIGVSNLGGVVL
ncbi:MAG: twin-arginine translocation signal domain-containing protein [Desulfobulbaceae bacterium]|nr:twin-arginine translocation signal domain-containing protein [Desulfobulbaceae bacterium]